MLKTSVRLEIPVLFIQGMQDLALTPQRVKESLMQCRRATLKQLPNAGHRAHLDQIETLNQMILEFITQREYEYTSYVGNLSKV